MLRPIKVRQYVNFMSARGFSPDAVLADTHIELARLADPAYLIDAQQCHAVVSNLMRLSGDPGIGLKVGAAISLNDLGIVGYAMASSSTLGQAIGLWRQYGNSPVGGPFTLKLIEPDRVGCWGAAAMSSGVTGSVYRFYVEETMVMGVNFCRVLTGLPINIKEMSCSFPAPAHAQRYQRQFGCAVRFNAPETFARVTSPTLDTPVKSGDSELRELCIRHCRHLVRQISRNGPVGARLRNYLTTAGVIPALDEAAEALAMSPRSLRRHLQQEQTSFQAVLDEFRGDLAREYLSTGTMPAKEVAYLLGFTQVDSFRRAFRAWTGHTVGGFQAAGRGTERGSA